uniref:Dilute domain-containing protein n=1 Tax=Nelumbo nucifera TaxID=4432 RepID=A0A822Z617_NELNU|nr:TPA_asm: hypothetical protein HUJ06_007609 [Nelumbo nucifera]
MIWTNQHSTSTASIVHFNSGWSYFDSIFQANTIAHWQSITKIRKVITQIFSFINVHPFNNLLLPCECCSFSNGEYVKVGLAELEQWRYNATEEYAGSAWDELKHIKQAVGFLVIHQKPEKTLNEITKDLCPVLSIQQLHRISTMYWDDKYGTHSVPSDRVFHERYRQLKHY